MNLLLVTIFSKVSVCFKDCSGKLAVLQRPIVMSERVTTVDGRINIQIQGVIRNKIQFSTRPTPIRQQSQKVVPQTSAS